MLRRLFLLSTLLWLAPLALVVAAVVVAATTSHVYTVAGPSMQPTLRPGDRVFVSTLVYSFRSPHRNDLVAFKAPRAMLRSCPADRPGTSFKRIVAAPGQLWQGRRVPARMYAVIGDNRASSCDSRRWGLLARSAIVGPVVVTYWPLRRISIR